MVTEDIRKRFVRNVLTLDLCLSEGSPLVTDTLCHRLRPLLYIKVDDTRIHTVNKVSKYVNKLLIHTWEIRDGPEMVQDVFPPYPFSSIH